MLCVAGRSPQRQRHPRGAAPPDLDADCAATHLLVSSKGDPFSGLVDDVLRAAGRGRQVAVSLESYAVAPTIIAASDLFCTLPRRFLQRYAGMLDLFEPPIALPPVEITACCPGRAGTPVAARAAVRRGGNGGAAMTYGSASGQWLEREAGAPVLEMRHRV